MEFGWGRKVGWWGYFVLRGWRHFTSRRRGLRGGRRVIGSIYQIGEGTKKWGNWGDVVRSSCQRWLIARSQRGTAIGRIKSLGIWRCVYSSFTGMLQVKWVAFYFKNWTHTIARAHSHILRGVRQGCAIGTDVIEFRVIIASVFCFEKAANSCKVHIQWGEIQIACLHQLSKLHLAQSMYSPHQFHHHHCRNHLNQTIHVNQKQ